MALTQNEVAKLVSNAINALKNHKTGLITGLDLQNIDLNTLFTHSVAIAYQESKFNPDAKNKNSSAKGLFQVLDPTRKDIESRLLKIKATPYEDIWKPEYNTFLGVAYLAYQFKRYKDWNKAIIAYNLGSWRNQNSTAYSKTHFKYYNELFPGSSNYAATSSSRSSRKAFK